MDHQVIWTEPAIEDLQAIVTHIARDNQAAAQRVGFAILDHTDVLAGFPRLGPVYETTGTEIVRMILAESYHIFYRVLGDPPIVEIMHVRHTAQQPPQFT